MRINYIYSRKYRSRHNQIADVNTDNEVADVLTKLLPVAAHQIHKEFLKCMNTMV